MRSARTFVILLAFLSWPNRASAQQALESAGSRALGMAGAFVAVADDGTAVYWNPAGLPAGPLGGITIGWVDFHSGNQDGPPAAGAAGRQSKFVSLGTWPIGVSYGQFDDNRLVQGPGETTRLEALTTSQFGATIVQTLLPGLVVGSTFKYVRGSFISAETTGGSAHEALSRASDFEGPASNHFDLDLGAMADFGRARLGLLVKNLRQPRFTDAAENATQLERHARLGLAVFPASGLTLAMDVDLNRVDLQGGPRRMMAFGGEDRFGRRWAVRAGVRWSLEGSRQTVGALGLSVRVRPNLWVDAHYTEGRLDADRGFGAALRAGF